MFYAVTMQLRFEDMSKDRIYSTLCETTQAGIGMDLEGQDRLSHQT